MATQSPVDPVTPSSTRTSTLATDKTQSSSTASHSPATGPKQNHVEDDAGIWRLNRRNLLSLTGWLAFLSFIITSTIGALRYMFPRVLFEPPTKFKAGFPQDYIIGEVSDKYKDAHRVWIVRNKDGFYSLVAICTHLGCTPRWLPTDDKFKCPCHGSGFYKSGINFEGPAPRPLERAQITLADDGQIQVDTSVTFRYEMGQWGKPGSFLPYTG